MRELARDDEIDETKAKKRINMAISFDYHGTGGWIGTNNSFFRAFQRQCKRLQKIFYDAPALALLRNTCGGSNARGQLLAKASAARPHSPLRRRHRSPHLANLRHASPDDPPRISRRPPRPPLPLPLQAWMHIEFLLTDAVVRGLVGPGPDGLHAVTGGLDVSIGLRLHDGIFISKGVVDGEVVSVCDAPEMERAVCAAAVRLATAALAERGFCTGVADGMHLKFVFKPPDNTIRDEDGHAVRTVELPESGEPLGEDLIAEGYGEPALRRLLVLLGERVCKVHCRSPLPPARPHPRERWPKPGCRQHGPSVRGVSRPCPCPVCVGVGASFSAAVSPPPPKLEPPQPPALRPSSAQPPAPSRRAHSQPPRLLSPPRSAFTTSCRASCPAACRSCSPSRS